MLNEFEKFKNKVTITWCDFCYDSMKPLKIAKKRHVEENIPLHICFGQEERKYLKQCFEFEVEYEGARYACSDCLLELSKLVKSVENEEQKAQDNGESP